MRQVPIRVQDLSDRVARAYRHACRVELEALKPGNVHRYADGHGMSRADFVASAEASVGPLTRATGGIGERVYRAVAATRRAVGCNTNLGILMLSAPLLQAVLAPGMQGGLRQRLQQVLSRADPQQTDWLFRAICLAAPAGLGRSDRYDVNRAPDATLREVMAHAAPRDLIARQYVNGFGDLFDYAVPLLHEYQARWQDQTWAAVALFLNLLKNFPDTHIVRKQGMERAREASEEIAGLADEFCRAARPEAFLCRLLQVDTDFKRQGINPGTSADLTVAAVLISHLEPIPCTLEPKAGIPRTDDTRPVAAGVRTVPV